jgi:ribosome maturation factor RimP
LADLEILRDIIAPEAKALGFGLVRVAWVRGDGDEPTLQIMAERPDTRQLNIDDCAALSRRLSARFDALEEAGRDPFDAPYRLEVSSPGIDRPLTRMADFSDWAGYEAKVELAELVEGRKSLRGDLLGVEGGMILIDDRKSGRIAFSMDQMAYAKLVLTDRLIAATAPIDMSGADDFEDEPTEQEEQD